MAQRQKISLETQPHAIELEGLPDQPGPVELLFMPEVYGDEFLDAYGVLQDQLEACGLAGPDADTRSVDAEKIRTAMTANREFLATFMLDHSAELFASIRLPDRVVMQITETVVGFYNPDRPTGSSNASPRPSSKGGQRSTGTQRSKGKSRAGSR